MMILLDLLGTKNPKFYNFFDSTSHWHELLAATEKALKSNGLGVGRSSNYFQSRKSYGGIEDDHIPFVQRGVDIVHLIPSPFPSVWHTAKDNKEALDFPTIENLNRIMRVFVASYLHLTPA
jgi:glutaminyl-peptide cyclotransferase